MIEAVNSVVSNASSLRGSAEQVSTVRSLAANPGRIQEVAVKAPELPKAPYISPYISLDYNYDRAVLQIRDSDTGEVQDQFPTESRLAALQRAEISRQQSSVERVQYTEEAKPPPEVPVAKQAEAAPVRAEVQASDIVTVQEVVSTTPSNTPQVAVAALSAGAQSGQSTSSGVSVLA